jgi:hypothetical protein
MGRDSVVGIATGYGLYDRGIVVGVSVGGKNIFFSASPRSALGPTQLPIQWVPGALSQRVKRQGCEADNSPPNSAQIKKRWMYISIPTYAFMGINLSSYNMSSCSRSEVLTTVTILCDMTPCSPIYIYWRVGRTHFLHFQGRKVALSWGQAQYFLRKFDKRVSNHTTSHSRRQVPSLLITSS